MSEMAIWRQARPGSVMTLGCRIYDSIASAAGALGGPTGGGRWGPLRLPPAACRPSRAESRRYMARRRPTLAVVYHAEQGRSGRRRGQTAPVFVSRAGAGAGTVAVTGGMCDIAGRTGGRQRSALW